MVSHVCNRIESLPESSFTELCSWLIIQDFKSSLVVTRVSIFLILKFIDRLLRIWREDENLYPEEEDLKEFDPEAIDENTDMDSDPVEGQETADFEKDNEE